MLSTPGWNHSTHLLGSSPRLWKAALNTEGDVPAIALAVQVTPPQGGETALQYQSGGENV